MIKYLLAFLCFFPLLLSAQRGFTPARGAKSLSMGGLVSVSTEIDAILNNQAGLASMDGYGLIATAEQRFLLDELRTVSFGASYEKKDFGTVGLLVSSFGIAEYKEQKFALAYARKLLDQLSIGGQLDYLTTRIQGYGSSNSITFEFGLQSKFNDEIMMGFHMFSPGQVSQGTESNIPTRMNLGFAYIPSDKLIIGAEVEKIVDLDFAFRGGVSYAFAEQFILRAGVSTGETTFSFGLGYALQNALYFDGAFSQHETLGITPAASVKYFKEK